MAKSIYSCVLLGNPAATGEIALKVGLTLESAITAITGTGNGQGILTAVAGQTSPNVHAGTVVDDTLGVAFQVDSAGAGEQIFITVDGAAAPGVVVQASTLAGTIDRTKGATATESFIAGVAVGVAIAK